MIKDKNSQKKIAIERIEILFREAEDSFKKNPNLSNRYVQIARNIAMKVNLKIPRTLKKKYCSHCYSYLKTGINARIRTRNKMLIIYCFKCKKYTKLPFS